MTREEFAIKRLREDTKLYRVTYVLLLVTGAGLVCALAAFALLRPEDFQWGSALIALAVLAYLPALKAKRDTHQAALAEIEEGDGTQELSMATRQVLGRQNVQPEVLRQLVIAYGILAVMLTGFAVLLFVLGGAFSFDDDLPLLIGGIVLLAMAAVLWVLFVKALGNLKIAKTL